MATLKDLRDWIHPLYRFGIQNIEFPEDECAASQEKHLHFNLYTDINRYSVKAIERESGKSYLGCIASSRKPRAGEDWTRGRDMADGDLSYETWVSILSDIVSYELVKVHFHNKDSESVVDEVNS